MHESWPAWRPLQAEALTEIGKLLHKQRNYRTAAAQLQKAVDLKPDSLQVLQCSCLRSRAAADHICCAIIVKRPAYLPMSHLACFAFFGMFLGASQARTFLGLCQVSMGEIQLGASNYERVLKLDPDNLDACVYLAQARKEVGSGSTPMLPCQLSQAKMVARVNLQ